MIYFFLLVLVVLIGLTAAAVMGRIGGFMAEPTSSQAFAGIPPGSLSSNDIGSLHIDQALRGYRMDQVDDVLDSLRARLGELEAEIVALRGADALAGASIEEPTSRDIEDARDTDIEEPKRSEREQ